MKSREKIFGFIALFFLIFLCSKETQSQTLTFFRDLKLGDSGEDVRQLQKLLNSDTFTQITVGGPGSPGEETNYFGLLTESAVKKLQQKYANEVLFPLGLISPTGFVGLATRAKLNALLYVPPLPTPTPAENNSILGFDSSIFGQSDEFIVSLISPYSGPVGTKVTLYGSGFDPLKNTVRFGDEFSISDLPSSQNALSLTIPEVVSPGRYDITLKNSRGTSKSAVFFVVTRPDAVPPTVSSVEPQTGSYGKEITIHGEHFTSTGNQIRTSYGIVENINSPDGKTLTFKVKPFPGMDGIEHSSGNEAREWDIYFYVVNENGISKIPAVFTLKL